MEELLKRHKIRRKFRGFIHAVIINKAWLMDDEDRKIGSNVKRNIALLIRPRTQTGILTLKDKSLIRIPPWSRSVAERKRLITLMSSLTCFEQIPPKLKARIIPHIKYSLLSPGKTIIKEGFDPLAVYYVLTGEVVLSKKLGDEDVVELIRGPGATVGETEVVEGTKRMHTAKTAGRTELLSIFITDYNQILLPYMKRQWEYKRKAITCFEHFNYFTEDQKSFLYRISSLKEYKPLDTICTSDEGHSSLAYFVVSGQCMILQSLRVKVVDNGYSKQKTLCDINDDECSKHFAQRKVHAKIPYQVSVPDLPVPDSELQNVINIFNKSAYLRYISPCGIQLTPKKAEEVSSEESIKVEARKSRKMSRSLSINKSYLGISRSLLNFTNITYEMHFIDVGSFTSGSAFGLGEKFEHRAIMARTTCQILAIPRYWLLERKQNIGNQWEKVKVNLNEIIPSRELLFKDYIATCKWERYKKNLAELNITKKTDTKIEDIPIICRALETVINF